MDTKTTVTCNHSLLVFLDGDGVFLIPGTRQSDVSVLADDLSEAVTTGDRIRFEGDLRALHQAVRTFGSRIDGIDAADIILPRADASVIEARGVLAINTRDAWRYLSESDAGARHKQHITLGGA